MRPFDGEWYQAFKVRIRRGFDMVVRPEAEQLDGRTFMFRYGWKIDTSRYFGEDAWLPADANWPVDAPVWIASGDLVESFVPVQPHQPTVEALAMAIHARNVERPLSITEIEVHPEDWRQIRREAAHWMIDSRPNPIDNHPNPDVPPQFMGVRVIVSRDAERLKC